MQSRRCESICNALVCEQIERSMASLSLSRSQLFSSRVSLAFSPSASLCGGLFICIIVFGLPSKVSLLDHLYLPELSISISLSICPYVSLLASLFDRREARARCATAMGANFLGPGMRTS